MQKQKEVCIQMARKEYEDPVEQVMFILGFKHDPRFSHALDAMKANSNPGIINAVDQVEIYGQIHANFCGLARINAFYEQHDPNSPLISKNNFCEVIVEELNEKNYGGKWFPATEKPPEHWINMGAYSPVFRRRATATGLHQGSAEAFCLPAPYFNLLSKVLENLPRNDVQTAATKPPESGVTDDARHGVSQVPLVARETVLEPEKHMDDESARLRGVGGWLLLFCIVTAIIAPLAHIADAANSNDTVVILIDVAFTMLAFCTGLSVWRVRHNAFRWVRAYLITAICLGVVAYVISLGQASDMTYDSTSPTVAEHITTRINRSQTIGSVIAAVIWWQYFKKSKRVNATFGKNL